VSCSTALGKAGGAREHERDVLFIDREPRICCRQETENLLRDEDVARPSAVAAGARRSSATRTERILTEIRAATSSPDIPRYVDTFEAPSPRSIIQAGPETRSATWNASSPETRAR